MTLDEAIELAIENTLTAGVSDIFGAHFEVELIRDPEFRHKLHENIKETISRRQLDQLGILPIQHILVPKSSRAYDYRRATLMHLTCHLKYLTLAILCAEIIEKNKIGIGENVVFSHRFHPDTGALFSNEMGYSQWLSENALRRANPTIRVIVKCDISSFYDRINLHRLKSTLESIGIEPWIINSINDILFYWSKKDSYGLPIGTSASRILAEAVLLDLDEYLADEEIIFTRYVDDYRLFAPDLHTAQRWLIKLTTRLFRDGLMLNPAKTAFVDARKTEEEITIEKEKTEKVMKEITRLVGAYNKVPRVFKMPKDEKYEVFKSIELSKCKSEIESMTVIEFDNIQKLILGALVQQKYEFLEDCPTYMLKCSYGIDYIVDMLVKNKNDIPEGIRLAITNSISNLILSGTFNNLDWYESKLLLLLSDDFYYQKKTLMDFIKKTPRTTTSFPLMVSMEGLFSGATRADVKTIREMFDVVDQWLKRRIIKLVYLKLPLEERNAWFRSIKVSVKGDIITERILDLAIKDKL
jgi:hypothetical protein